MEARRDEFRNYLETSGAITALTNALIKLFDLPEKPENSVEFICQNLACNSGLESENEALKARLNQALEELAMFTGRASHASSKIRFSVSGAGTDLEKLQRGFDLLQQDEASNSLLKNTLTMEMIEELASVSTELQSTLLDCVLYGLVDPEATIGVIAADADCFNAFDRLFEPIVCQYHRIESLPLLTIDWGDLSTLPDPDPEKAFIQKCQVQCFRSASGFPFFLKMDESGFLEVMEIVRKYATDNGQAEAFFELETMDEDTQNRIGESKTLGVTDFLFGQESECWVSQRYSAHWPKGRAIHFVDANEVVIQVNHDTHIQFGCVQSDGSLLPMYERIANFAQTFEAAVPCARHDKYGWLNPSMQYLGTAMEISALVKLSQLPTEECNFKDLLSSVNLKLARMEQEEGNYLCEIQNARCLGVSEFQLMQEFNEGLAKVFEAEGQTNTEPAAETA